MSAIPSAREIAEACGKASLKGKNYSCCCPAHPDKNPSLTIPDRARWWTGVKCWSQECDKEAILAEMSRKYGVEFPKKKDKEDTYEKGEFGGKWEYEDLVEGKWQVVYRSLRFNKSDGSKSFAQQVLLDGEWKKPGKYYTRPLYNKRAIVEGLNERPRAVYVTEGEKCADLLIAKGYLATTNGGSTSEWAKEEHSEPLRKAPMVIVLADLDKPGMKKALNVVRSLHLVGIKCKLIVLPDMGPIMPENGKDVVDWFHQDGHTEAKFLEVIKSAPFWQPEESDGFADLFDTNVVDMAPKQKLPDKSPFAQTTALDFFLKKYAQDIRFCEGKRKGWFWWCGTHWKNVTAGKIKDLVEIAMVEYARHLARFNPEPVRYARWLDQSQGKRWLMDITSMAESRCEFDFSLFDANPYYLCVANGVVDLRTGQVLQPEREMNCSKIITLEYHPEKYQPEKDKDGKEIPFEWSTVCPKWMDFQLYVFAGDWEIMYYFQRQAGYFLTGLTSFKVLPFWHGDAGWNGKTVAKELYLKIMGPYARIVDKALVCVGGAETKQGNPIQILGYRLAVIDELDSTDRIDKGIMKRVSGRDSLSAGFLFEETQTFAVKTKLLMVANKLPYMDGTGDPAAWQRVQTLAYDVTIAEKDRVEDYEAVLYAEEGEAILAWMIQGSIDCLNGYLDKIQVDKDGKPVKMPKGLNPPAKVSGRTEEWRQSFDVLGEFIDEWCNIGEGCVCRANKLFTHFLAFMKSEGYNQTWHKQRFGRELIAKKVKNQHGKLISFIRDRSNDSKRETIYLNIEPRYVEESTN